MHRVCARMRDPWCNLRINRWETPGSGPDFMAPNGFNSFPGLADDPVGRDLSKEREAEFPAKPAGASATDGGMTKVHSLQNLEQ